MKLITFARMGRVGFGVVKENGIIDLTGRIHKDVSSIKDLLKLDLIEKAEDVANELTDIPSFDIPEFDELFSEEKYVIKNLKKVFLMLAGAGMKKFGMDLEKEQEVLLRISEIIIEIYMSESAILRTEKNSKRFGLENQSSQIAMSKLYLYESCELIIKKAKELIVSLSNGTEQKFLLSGLKRFTKYFNYPNTIELKRQVAKVLQSENKYPF
mgnify:CR=1 FL=1